MSRIQLNSRAWSIQRTAATQSGGRRSLAPASSGFPAEFLAEGATIDEEFIAQPSAAVRRGAGRSNKSNGKAIDNEEFSFA